MGIKKRLQKYLYFGNGKVQYYDYSLLAVIICLVTFGLVMLYSTSTYSAQIDHGSPEYFFKRQLLFSLLGMVVMLVVSMMEYHRFADFAKVGYIISAILLFLVKFSPLGKEVAGAKRWLIIPGIGQFQPAEFTKIVTIIFLSSLICHMGNKIGTKDGVLAVLGCGGIQAAMVFVLTRNLSSGLIIGGITMAYLYVAHPRSKKGLAYTMGIAAGLFVLARIVGNRLSDSESFRMRRIIAWVNPEKHAGSLAFQTMQAKYAIGSGGFFGKGLGCSAQKMMIPEVQNDMILSVICEELGVFGALVILAMFGLLLYRLVFIAKNAPDKFGAFLVLGIFAHIALQVILNMAVVTNVIPNTGITLPFISYGGTAVLFLMAEMGIALSVSRQVKIDEIDRI